MLSVIVGFFTFEGFPILVFLALLKERKTAAVCAMYFAYIISLGYQMFLVFFFMACGYSFNALEYYMSGVGPFRVINIIILLMAAAPLLPCFKDKRKTIVYFYVLAHLCIIMFFVMENVCSWTLRKFDAQKWDEVHYIRNEMFENIRDSRLLQGKDTDGIRAVLGEPDRIEDFGGGVAKYIYYSGNGSFISVYIENYEYRDIYYVPSTGIGQH